MQIEEFGKILKDQGLQNGSGVPCSIFKLLVNYMTADPLLDYLPASSEGEAVAIAAGLTTAGRPAFSLMQNSGLGNAVNPITSLLYIYRIPVMLLVSHRGQPGKPDEPQHELMGQITHDLAKLCSLQTYDFQPENFKDTLGTAIRKSEASAWIFPKGALKGDKAEGIKGIQLKTIESQALPSKEYKAELTREEALKVLLPYLNQGKDSSAVVSTTGKLSRELYELDDKDHSRSNRFYMVGSMGCAAPFGLGIAHAENLKMQAKKMAPRKVLVLDGDGAVMMKMGALGTIGMVGAANFHHIVFDNGAYESTGGQPTCSPYVDLTKVATACGYRRADTVSHASEFQASLEQHLSTEGPTMLRMLIKTGSRPDLGRPTLTPRDSWLRFRDFLRGES